jgi:protein-disulfide isomerase
MLTRRLGFLALGAWFAASSSPAAAPAYVEQALGRADAPVTIIEYASFTCPHCADFHNGTFPKLRAAYIDTGKVRYVFRDYPLDRTALLAAAVAHCAGSERFFGFVDVLFQTQRTWATAEDPTKMLHNVGRLGGLDGATIDACLADDALLSAIVGSRQRGEDEFGVNSTPTLIINGEVYEGSKEFDDLSAAIDRLLPPS